MKEVHQWPPNIQEISKVFPLDKFNPVFTYGNILYNPLRKSLPTDLIRHEEVHEKQQEKMGKDNWWKLYLEDKKFRLEQEVEAYREQARFVETYYNRKMRKLIRKELPKHLSSALYGNLINKQLAEELIYG